MSFHPRPTNHPASVALKRGVCAKATPLSFALLLLLTPLVAHAQSKCDPAHPPDEPLATLLTRLTECEKSPNWLIQLGELLLQEGRFVEATEHLERALMLQPTSLPAAFAYSLALAGSGDLTSALHLLAEVTQRPNLPPNLQPKLLQVQQRLGQMQNNTWPTAQAVGWQHRNSAGLRVGRDSNLLGAPRLGNLTLTLPSGDISLPVESASQPRPGVYQRTDLRTEHTHTGPTGRRTELTAALQYRSSPAAVSANTIQADIALDTQPGQTASQWPLWASASAATLNTHGNTHYQSTSLAGGWAWPHHQCQQRVGAEIQQRNLSSNPILSGQYSGMVANWACQDANTATKDKTAPPWWPHQWHIGTRLGADSPTDSTRPGGRQHQLGLRASARWQRWTLDADAQRARDTTGYSPILANNATRTTTRVTLRLEHHRPQPQWGEGTHTVWGIEVYRQKSNLELFKINSANAYVALRKQW